jgi:hypothetical protein
LQWDPEDKAKVIAYMLENALRCSMCGTAEWEWEENRFAYTPVDKFCRGCYQKSVFGDQEGGSLPGTNVTLVATTKMLSAQSKVKAMKAERARRRARQEAEDGG